MDNSLEEKLGAILSDPDMMQKIQSLAHSLGQSSPQPQNDTKPVSANQTSDVSRIPDLDFSSLQKLSNLMRSSGIDQNQQTLLSALTPYLSSNRVAKLEKAMRAAKMARFASAFLGSGGIKMLSGR